MENSNQKKDLIQIYYKEIFYLDYTTACEVIGLPRTSLLRLTDKFKMLQEEDVLEYKNRKLIKTEWVFNFWKSLSSKSK